MLEPVDQLADLGVGMFDEPGENLHQLSLEGALATRECCPRRAMRLGARGQLRVRRESNPVAFCRAKTRSR